MYKTSCITVLVIILRIFLLLKSKKMLATTKPKGLPIAILFICLYMKLTKLNSTNMVANSIKSIKRAFGDKWLWCMASAQISKVSINETCKKIADVERTHKFIVRVTWTVLYNCSKSEWILYTMKGIDLK